MNTSDTYRHNGMLRLRCPRSRKSETRELRSPSAQIHCGGEQGARTKGYHSTCRNHHGFTGARISSLASQLVSNRKLAKFVDADRLSCLKGGLEQVPNPL